MRLFNTGVVLVLILSSLCAAQQAKKPVLAKAPVIKAAAGQHDGKLPTEAELDQFFHQMFGYDPAITWKILGIMETDSPGVTHVIASLGGQAPIHMYVTPDRKFATVGEMIPFGTDPFTAARDTLAAKAKGMQRGPVKAAVTLVEFSDLQCPFCRTAQPVIDRLLSESPEAQLVFQPFPLPMHKWALKAASLAECVGKQKPEAFWTFIEAVYDAQPKITEADADKQLKDLVAGAGVNAAQAATCAESPEVYLRIQQSIELGKTVGVNSTPTLFINGRKVLRITDTPFETLKAMVAFEAAEAKKRIGD